jgi:hypothetical protein
MEFRTGIGSYYEGQVMVRSGKSTEVLQPPLEASGRSIGWDRNAPSLPACLFFMLPHCSEMPNSGKN